MNNLDKLLGTYTGIMTIILTIGALMTLTNSSPILLLIIFPLTGYMVVQGVKAFYGLKYGPKRSDANSNSSTIDLFKSKQAQRSSLSSNPSLRYFFAQNGKGFLVTLALLAVAITSLVIKKQLTDTKLISPIPQQQVITFNVR